MLTVVVVFPVPPLWLKIARRCGPWISRRMRGIETLGNAGECFAVQFAHQALYFARFESRAKAWIAEIAPKNEAVA